MIAITNNLKQIIEHGDIVQPKEGTKTLFLVLYIGGSKYVVVSLETNECISALDVNSKPLSIKELEKYYKIYSKHSQIHIEVTIGGM